MQAITTIATPGETAALCHSVGVSRATLYRHRRPAPPPRPRAPSPRALGPTERQAVLDVLHSPRFVDQSPTEVHATLLEEQTYLCSPRTMYRVLAAAHEVRERRAQARHPAYAAPELVATGPNQVWSWDITKLKGPVPYLYYSLYVILDLFSRYVVGWMVARHENAHLAERLLAATCAKQGITPHQLTIHADRGAPMRSTLVALLFSDLGITASHSRPRVSNDNPFSEAQFRTVKYRPEFPARFGALEHARGVSRDLFAWYNDAHHHSGELSDARRRPLRPRRNRPGGPSPHAPGRLCRPSRAVRARATPPRDNAHGGLDQSAADPHQPGGPSHDHRHPGRPTAKLHAPATTHRQSPGHVRHQRGVATVNAESGCLKVVDTARIGNRFPPPPLFLHDPGRLQGTQGDPSRLDGCRQTLDVERVRPQTTRRQLVTETRSHGFDSRRRNEKPVAKPRWRSRAPASGALLASESFTIIRSATEDGGKSVLLGCVTAVPGVYK